MRFTKAIAAALALSIGALTFAGTAEAGDRRHHRSNVSPYATGAIGFAAGAILGSALSQPRYYSEPRYYAEPRYYYEPAPVYVAPRPVYVQPSYTYVAEPWTPGWYSYCGERYRSFNARTGYYTGYDGQYHFCR